MPDLNARIQRIEDQRDRSRPMRWLGHPRPPETLVALEAAEAVYATEMGEHGDEDRALAAAEQVAYRHLFGDGGDRDVAG